MQVRQTPCAREGGSRKVVSMAMPARPLSRLLVALPIFFVLLSGCKPVGPNYNQPTFTAPANYKEMGATTVTPPPNPPGGNWKQADPSDGMLKGKWWEIYHDPQLNSLEDRIATNNAELKQALDKYLAARDTIASVQAGLFPTLGANAQISRSRASYNQPNAPSSDSRIMTTEYLLEGIASWEPDFFGRVRRNIEQAKANAQVSAAVMANLDLALHAQMATAYFALRGLDSQSKLLAQTVSDLEHQLDLTQRRLAGGVATAVDVAQAQTELDNVRAQLVEVGVARAQFEHLIATLIDTDIGAFNIPVSPLDLALPKVPTGVPSQLLERRPDIATAERTAAAANAGIGIAISAYYPSITLGGPGGFETQHPGTWIQGPSAIWTLGAQAADLLFDAGQRHAITESARHNYEASVEGYRDSIFQAFEDVENQLSSLRILEQEAGTQAEAVASAQHTLDLANQRYQGGVTSYLEVLTAEQILLQDQSTAISLQSRQFAASVSLVRALGGGWDVTQLQ
jgi:NodT family efflux transporter outer membrane factor (OMF) lipoprotein